MELESEVSQGTLIALELLAQRPQGKIPWAVVDKAEKSLSYCRVFKVSTKSQYRPLCEKLKTRSDLRDGFFGAAGWRRSGGGALFHVEAMEVMAERIGAHEVLSVARSTKPDFKVKGRDLSCGDTHGNAEISQELH